MYDTGKSTSALVTIPPLHGIVPSGLAILRSPSPDKVAVPLSDPFSHNSSPRPLFLHSVLGNVNFLLIFFLQLLLRLHLQ